MISKYLSDIIEDIKNATWKQPFYTTPIKIKGMEWYLEFYPNGLSTSYKGSFEVFLCLRRLPKDLKWMKCDWSLRLKELDFVYTPYYNYQMEPWCNDKFTKNECLWRRTGDRQRRQRARARLPLWSMSLLEHLTFRFEVKYFAVLDIKNNFMRFDEYYAKPMFN